MINKDLGLFAYDSTNRETISAKRIENKHLLICKYLPSSLSSITSDIFTRISCLYRSFDSIRYIVEILIDQKAYYCSCICQRCQDLMEEGWNSFLFMSHLEIAAINIDKRYLCRLCRCTV